MYQLCRMGRVRLLYGLALWFDLHFLPVYFVCALGGCIFKQANYIWFLAITFYTPLQYARLQMGLNSARQETCFGLISSAVLGIPVFLIQLYFLRFSSNTLYLDVAMGVISFVFSVLETLLGIGFLLRVIKEIKTYTAVFQWSSISISAGVLLFALIYCSFTV